MATGIMLSEVEGLSVTLLEAESKLGGVFRTPYTSTAFYYPANRDEMIVLDNLIGNKSVVDDFYSDLIHGIELLEKKGVISNKSLLGFDNYLVEGEEKIQNTYGLDLLSWMAKAVVSLVGTLKSIHGSDFWYHVRYRLLVAFNLIEISDQLKTEIKKGRVEIHYNSRVSEVQEDRIVTEDGIVYFYDYVVFASGGLGRNIDLQRKLYNIEFNSHEFNKINTGFALQTAIDKGWKFNTELYAWYAEVVELRSGGVAAVLFQPGPGVLTVNGSGKRVYNEKRSYNERGKTTLQEKELLLITDKNNILHNTPAFVPSKYSAYLPTLNEGAYIEASSLEELSKIVREERVLRNISGDFEMELLEQWTRYHSFVETGIDLEFHRGNDIGEIVDGGNPLLPPANQLKNKALAPIDEKNLVAIRLLPSSLDTCSGPKVDHASRVQKLTDPEIGGCESFEPVRNVFAVGNCAEAILGGHYNAGGLPVSSGLVGAYRVYTALREVSGIPKRHKYPE